MLPQTKQDTLKRLNYLMGHLEGIKRMVEADTYCVDVLKQTHAVRRGIEKLETLMLDNHLRSCVVDGIKEGREEQVVQELLSMYEVSNR